MTSTRTAGKAARVRGIVAVGAHAGFAACAVPVIHAAQVVTAHGVVMVLTSAPSARTAALA